MSARKERLKEAIDFLISEKRVSSPSDLAEAMGKQRSYISELLSGKRDISESFVHKFTDAFPEISDRWLLFGAGEMSEITRMYDRINLILARQGISKRDFEKGTNTGNFIFPGVYRNAEKNPADIKVAAGWIDCILNLFPQYSEEWIKTGQGEMLRNSPVIENNTGVIISSEGNVENNSIDNRQYYSDSPDVLRAKVESLEKEIEDKLSIFNERIKEKDAQIKEKDAQIKQLLDILSKK